MRRAGILVPLFAIPSSHSLGIGEIGDIPLLAAWLLAAGPAGPAVLPINEMPPSERSPYSALSAMAIDPPFIQPATLEDFEALGAKRNGSRSCASAWLAARPRGRWITARPATLKQTRCADRFPPIQGRRWHAGTSGGRACAGTSRMKPTGSRSTRLFPRSFMPP